MAFRLSTASRDDACDGIVDALDGGSIEIWSGAAPTNVGDAPAGTLLGTCPLNATAFGASSTGTAIANAITSDIDAEASGDAGYFRIKNSAAAVMADGTCDQGAGDLSFDNKTIVAGGTIAISSFTITVPI